MASRSTLSTPSTFEGVVAGLHVTGEYEGKECRVSVEAGAEAAVTKVTVVGPGRITVNIKKQAKEDGPAVPPFPMPKPHNGNGEATGLEKRRSEFNERGELEYTTLEYLTEEEFEQETAGPPDRIDTVSSHKLPFGVCVEYRNRGKVVRTEWSKRFDLRRAA